MSTKTRYSKAPPDIARAIERSERVPDFLPPPDQLVPRDETVKVTLALSKRSVEFLKQRAKGTGVSYQAMIRRIVDLYSSHYNNS